MQQNTSDHFNEIPPFNQIYYKNVAKAGFRQNSNLCTHFICNQNKTCIRILIIYFGNNNAFKPNK